MASIFINGWRSQWNDIALTYENRMNSNFIVNKVLLAYSLAHLLMYCVWLLTTRAEKLLRRSFGLHSQKYLLSGPLETKFADSCLRARTQLD